MALTRRRGCRLVCFEPHRQKPSLRGLSMEYRKLGRTGLDVSILGIGTNDFGRRTDFERCKAILHKCMDLGVNFIDSSNVYAEGHSEEFIGEILGKTPQRADMI